MRDEGRDKEKKRKINSTQHYETPGTIHNKMYGSPSRNAQQTWTAQTIAQRGNFHRRTQSHGTLHRRDRCVHNDANPFPSGSPARNSARPPCDSWWQPTGNECSQGLKTIPSGSMAPKKVIWQRCLSSCLHTVTSSFPRSCCTCASLFTR